MKFIIYFELDTNRMPEYDSIEEKGISFSNKEKKMEDNLLLFTMNL